jgi:hypothetical protein
MSKIKINEIESASTDLTVTPTGTDGTLEVANEDQQSSIQLNDSLDVHKVKVKGPSNTASQDYTLVLPATNITADKFVKVDSLTGSGSTAIAHLGYHTFTPADENNLVGSSFTSGTVPATRYNLSGTLGGGLKLVQKQTVTTQSAIQRVAFTGLEDNTMYRIFIVNAETYSAQTATTQGPPQIRFADDTYDAANNIGYLGSKWQWDHIYYDGDYYQEDTNAYYYSLNTAYGDHNSFVIDLYNAAPTVSNQVKFFAMGRGISVGNSYNRWRGYITWKEYASDTTNFTKNPSVIEFQVEYLSLGSSIYHWAVGTEFALYKYDAT